MVYSFFRRKTVFDLYLSFLRAEIPNIIQIITLMSFISYLLDINIINQIINPALIGIILFIYLSEKEFCFLKAQITNDYSEINRRKWDDDKVLKLWTKYSLVTSFIFSILASLLGNLFLSS